MARMRSGGGSGYAWALVAFGGGFFICLLLAIVFYTKIDAATQAEAAAASKLKAVATDAELNNAIVQDLEGSGGGTIVAKLLNRVTELDTKVGGLEGELSNVKGELKTAEERLEQQTEATEKALAAANAAQDSKNKIEKDLTEKVSAMSERIDAADKLNQDMQSQMETANDAVTKSSKDTIADLTKKNEDLNITKLENERTIEDLERQLKVALAIADPAEGPPVTLADGRIVSQIPDQNKVYLDLGREDGLQLGMTFNVFDADALVKPEDADSTGKAIIEIIGLENASSVARIVEKQRLAVIANGDIVINLAYDPSRILKFNIFGQYDLNNDGKIDDGDADRIKQLVSDSRGVVMDELTFETDYLVLGEEPPVPEEPTDPRDLVKMRLYREALENYQNYQARISLAREFKVPVLNQNRLLDLIGYYTK